MPAGFDTVLRQEDCVRVGDSVRVNERPRVGLNVRAIGEYADQGEVLLFAETELKPHHIGLLASIGFDRVLVRRKIRVGIASIGDELSTSQGELAHGSIFDSNRPLLKALAHSPSSEIQDFGVFRDDEESLRGLFAAAHGLDVLVTSAGASVGEFDLVRSVLNGIGGTIDAWQVAMKPGKPLLFGHFGKTRFLGLPGNPMAAFVGYKLFGEPISQRLQGRINKLPLATRAISGFDSSRHPMRMEFVPVVIDSYDDQDRPVLRRVSHLGPGSLVPLAKADGLAVIRPGTEPLNVGQKLEWRRF
ncbi:molybdopterin molybdotransferase [Rhizobium sp. BK060]|nr:molybdopterin molybdotransferase [Rhizobium sp. BK060]